MISAVPTVYTVTELNDYVKTLFDCNENLSTLFLNGEISNFTPYQSGHLYFTLKDENAAIKAVMFSGYASKLKFRPENGMKVLVIGSVSLYSKTGSYQINIRDMQPDGLGALNLAYEQLKSRLAKEGLFDETRKKPIPRFPKRIGVVTSGSGAAVRDIFNVLGRRWPAAEVVLKPVQVQGEGAAADIARAIRLFNEKNTVDVLIVGRGGGSIEDLWAFNEEIVARAVSDSEISVISAVGHETDFTICDFVADLRAPTPSAAAELAVPDSGEMLNALDSVGDRLVSIINSRISDERKRLELAQKALAFASPVKKVEDGKKYVEYAEEKLASLMLARIDAEKAKLASACGKLNALNPLGVISRGYAAVYENGRIVSKTADVKVGDILNVRMSDGSIKANILEINGDENGK